MGAILAGCYQRPAGPDALAIKPGSTPFGPSIHVDITGTGFYPLARANFDDENQSGINTTFRALLGTTELDVTWRSKTLLVARVPANLQRGIYDLTVIDPLGRSGVKKQAFRVGDPPDGGTADARDATADGPGRDAGSDADADADADASQDLQKTDLPLTPDLPVKPDLPLAPDLPVKPDLPLTPDLPVKPDLPLAPDLPLTPDLPLAPDAPLPDAPLPDAPLPDAASPDQSQKPPTGYAAWIKNGQYVPWFGIYDGTKFPTQGFTAKGGQWRTMAAAEAPTRTELILVGVDVGNLISGVVGSYASGWKTIPHFPLNTNKVSETYWWGTDVAYESVSGHALMVWNNADSKNGQLGYATFDGTTWSAKQIATAYTGDEPQQMYLAASPTSDQMVLVLNDKQADHYALVWSGSSWGNQRLLDATGTAESDQTALAAAYEQQSGRAMVVYGKNTKTGGYYRTWNGSAWSSEGTFPGSSSNQVQWFTLAANAGSNKLIVGALTTGSNSADVWVNVWDGAAFGAATQVESSAAGSIYPNVAVAFESTSGHALVVYGQASNSVVRYRTLGTSSIWSAEQLGPNLGQTPNTLLLRSHPTSDKIMLAAQDGGKDVSYVLWSGTGWATPIQLESDSGETKNQPFEFVWDR